MEETERREKRERKGKPASAKTVYLGAGRLFLEEGKSWSGKP